MRRTIQRWLRGRAEETVPHVRPEFGVRVRLKKGDKIVSRDADGRVGVRRITEEEDDLDVELRRRPT
jgi:hypothetical protein